MRIPVTRSAIEVFSKARLEPVSPRRMRGESRSDRGRTPSPRPLETLLVAARLRAARV